MNILKKQYMSLNNDPFLNCLQAFACFINEAPTPCAPHPFLPALCNKITAEKYARYGFSGAAASHVRTYGSPKFKLPSSPHMVCCCPSLNFSQHIFLLIY